MPKGADLSDASQTWLNEVAALLNNLPRKTENGNAKVSHGSGEIV